MYLTSVIFCKCLHDFSQASMIGKNNQIKIVGEEGISAVVVDNGVKFQAAYATHDFKPPYQLYCKNTSKYIKRHFDAILYFQYYYCYMRVKE